ncbi:(-)-germacrene D synthase-like [Juglans microcarpa x Juglans regia]|uniref:(-)-germacrene D synthase-like n=1 Tax=Juglans microcarpa x Juglans regia TaxID=2249226 RepID=UPI001B7EA68D|nr:(-)-germacrene D synthase-like [Juglans microcarpa x Juglans regia]
MSVPSSVALSQNAESDAIRRTANFEPSIWGDRFINNIPEDQFTHVSNVREVEELIEEVRRELLASADQPSKQLNIIDVLQRLGVAYHFERDIEEALERIYASSGASDDDNDLYNVSLHFRLLRQQGFRVSCDVFNKFKDEKSQFKESLSANIPGLLAFYEATHLRVHGEEILDAALSFTTTQLESAKSNLSNPLAAQVTHALKQSLHKGIPRLESRGFISLYQDDTSHNKAFLKLSILDFNLVQTLHKQELRHIARWWKDLDFATKLPFARDRVVECFFWIVAVYYEPQYSLARKILTKVIALTSIIDDIYDVYGTLEEIEIFTEAIERWNIRSMSTLPKYMQICYKALLDVFEEIEQELAKQGRSYLLSHAKEAMKILVRAYFDEAKSFHAKHIPTLEEYMRVALVTSGYPMLTVMSFLGMGDIAVTEETLVWAFRDPKIITASSVIGRLSDDIKSHKFEQERGHAASAVECYMKKYGVSEEVAYDELSRQVSDAWKDINEDCLRPTAVPMAILTRVLNLSRAIDVIYKDGDGYTHVGKEMKAKIESLLLYPVPI